MKLGVLLFPSVRGSAQLARMIEAMGFDSLVFADTQNITPEVWGQLMLAARDTERIELGTGVTNPGTRDAAVTASAALALQVESNGRAVCGIGRGDSSLGKIGRGPVPVDEFERYVVRLQGYLRGDEVDRDGTASRLEWHEGAGVPKVPLEIAATGKRVIEMAARHAERIVFAVGADGDRLARSIEIARRAAAAAGRDPDALQLGAWINAVIHPDVAAARAAVRGDGFGIVGPVEKAVPRFERLKALGLDFCRVVPGSRDAGHDVTRASLMTLATVVKAAVAPA
jgi:5,10-methylenetetrahydromethanopterin reductase